MINEFYVSRSATFKDCDPAGIVFFSNVFTYAHDAIEDLNRKLGTWDMWFNSKEYAAPIVSCNASFIAPIKLGQEVVIHFENVKAGSSSITFNISLKDKNKITFADVTTSHVFINKQTGKPCKIPDVIKSKLL